MYKFVFTTDDILFILRHGKYHMDTGVPRKNVSDAGFISIDHDSDILQVEMSGESSGYGIGFSLATQKYVNARLNELGITMQEFEDRMSQARTFTVFDLSEE